MFWSSIVRRDDKRLPTKALYCHAQKTLCRRRHTKTLMDNMRRDFGEKDMHMRTTVDTIRDEKK